MSFDWVNEIFSPESIRDHWFDHTPAMSSYTLLGAESAPKKYVYFIRSGDFIKIGCSAHPEERVKQIRRGGTVERPSSWDGEPYLIGYLPGDTKKEAEEHKQWSHLRDRGEWFHADEALVVYAEDVRIKQARLEVKIHEEARKNHCKDKGIELTETDLDEALQRRLDYQLFA